jgi:hypothetical protein
MGNLGCWSRSYGPRCASGNDQVRRFLEGETVVMRSFIPVIPLILSTAVDRGSHDWPQLQGDALRSGNAAGSAVKTPLGLAGAIPLTDGIYTAPVIAGGKVFAILYDPYFGGEVRWRRSDD